MTLRRRNELIVRKNNWAKWKLVFALTLTAANVVYVLPLALDVIYPNNDYFPRATVQAKEIEEPKESKLIPRKSNREEIKRVATEECTNKGLGDSCVKDLLGIAHTEETNFNCSMVGDSGNAFGCFQINLAQNPSVLEKDAKEIEYSVKWTLNRMVSHGYPEFRSYAIRKHNGGATNPKTLVYLNKVNTYVQSIEGEFILNK